VKRRGGRGRGRGRGLPGGRRRERWLLGRRTPRRRRSAVRIGTRRCGAIALRRTHGRADRFEALGRPRLISRRLRGREGGRRGRRRPGGRRRLRRSTGRRLIRLRRPLRRPGRNRRRRCVVLRRWRAPLRWRRRRGSGRRRRRSVVWRRGLGTWRWARGGLSGGQRRAAGKTKLAGRLVVSATPRADDHEYGLPRAARPIKARGLRPANKQQRREAPRSIPGFTRKGAKSLGVRSAFGPLVGSRERRAERALG
jgi:hypothetical protein